MRPRGATTEALRPVLGNKRSQGNERLAQHYRAVSAHRSQRMKSRHSQKVSESHSVMSDSLRPHGLYTPWNSPGQNTGVGSLSLLQGIFPTQGSNPGLPRCSRNLYQLSHKGSPRTLEWAACPLSSRSSRPRNQTSKSCIAGRFFTN